MTWMLRTLGSPQIFFAPDGGGAGGGAGDPPAGDPPASPESILFPKEGGEGDGEKPADGVAENATDDGKGATEWKEYVPDPAKSEAENAAAKAEHDKTKPADDPADKVPEDGKYTLTMPEGIEVDQELVDALGSDFKDMGLTNKQAQTLADKFIKVQSARMQKQGETWAGTVQKWADDAKADKDIGGDKWDGTVSASRRAVETLGTPALKDYLNASGGGNHPEMIRFMAKVGAMIKEDNPANGGAGGAGKPAEAAHILFPNDAPKGT